MSLYLYNTLGKKKEEFKSLDPNRVRMYHCGPTVYSHPHIGNFRAFIFADLLRRYFEYQGYEVIQAGRYRLGEGGILQGEGQRPGWLGYQVFPQSSE